MTTASKINLIDLAGSERASQVLNSQVIKTAETAALRLKVTMFTSGNVDCFRLILMLLICIPGGREYQQVTAYPW